MSFRECSFSVAVAELEKLNIPVLSQYKQEESHFLLVTSSLKAISSTSPLSSACRSSKEKSSRRIVR